MPKSNLGNALSIGADRMPIPKVNFKVNQYAVLLSSIASEIRARGEIQRHPEKRAKYESLGLLNPEWSKRINDFANENKEDFVKSKLFSRVEILETLVPFAGTPDFDRIARSRMEYEYQMSDEEIDAAMRILSQDSLRSLVDTSEFGSILMKTNFYRKKVESEWIRSSKDTLGRLYGLVGMEEIEQHSNDKNRSEALTVLIMPPSSRVQRIANKTSKEVTYCFSIPGEESAHKTAYTNGAILNVLMQDVMVPYSTSMTAEEKRKQHAYIRFVADKNTGVSTIRNASIFDFQTPHEDVDTMGRMYPAFLAYKYRRMPVEQAIPEIEEEIRRDKAGLERISNPELKQRMSSYRFDELSPGGIATLFRGKYVSPTSFAKIDLDDVGRRVYISPEQDIHTKRPTVREERIRE